MKRTIALPDGRHMTTWDLPGTKPPVVLLHGLLDSAAGWMDLPRESPRALLAVDLPGFGESDLPTRPRLSAYADDVLATLTESGIERFVLVGHSLGGGIAATMADRAPERVTGLVLLAPAGFGRIPMAEAVSIPGLRNLVARALPLALSNPVVLTAAYMTVVSNRKLPDGELLNRVMRRAIDAVPGAREGTRAVVAAGLSERGLHRRRLHYNGPAWAVWGDRDRLVPRAHAAALMRSLPQTKLEIWPGMGHHPQRERPLELARLIATAADATAAPAEEAA